MNRNNNNNNNLILGLFGVTLFFLVVSVLYFTMFFSETIEKNNLDIFMPLVVLTGLFIFLVAAMFVAMSIFRNLNG
jgi:hypothetical protein